MTPAQTARDARDRTGDRWPLQAPDRDPVRLRSLVAWAVAELDAVPAAVGHCYRCRWADYPEELCADRVQPMTLDAWLRQARVLALHAVLGDEALEHPFRQQLARLLGEHMAHVYRH
jgi:hypothetical protein